MAKPWVGAGRRLTDADIAAAARELGADVASIRAVWEVEASGSPFRRNGTLERRYEPHHFPGSGISSWRVSLALATPLREQMFSDAFAKNPEAAARATSWGGPQIMGFNFAVAGFPSALAMVEAMANSEKAQLAAFVGFVRSKGLVTALRQRDWLRFATIYNGDGQAEEYARRLRAAHSRHSGLVTTTLRRGATGADVRRLQAALGLSVDGSFGPATEAAVMALQRSKELKADGIVGPATWAAIDAPTVPVSDAVPSTPAITGQTKGLVYIIAALAAAAAVFFGVR